MSKKSKYLKLWDTPLSEDFSPRSGLSSNSNSNIYNNNCATQSNFNKPGQINLNDD